MKRRPQRFLALLPIWALLIVAMVLASPALAQNGDAPEIDVPVLPFPATIALTFLPAIAAVFAVCMMLSHRRDRDKPEEYKVQGIAEMRDGPKKDLRKRPERKGPEVCPDAQSALTLSIIGFFTCGIASIIGIIKGFAAKSKIASDRRLTGENTALMAIILGFVGIGLWLLGVVGLVLVLLL